MTNLSDWLTSMIRTGVPIIIGILAAWLASDIGFVIDEDTQANLVAAATGFAVSAYYGIVRWAEQRWPSVGWLLGVPKQPTY